MPRYTIGAQPTKDASGNPGAPQMVIIEADTYVIDNNFVTFLKDRRPIISVPFLKSGSSPNSTRTTRPAEDHEHHAAAVHLGARPGAARDVGQRRVDGTVVGSIEPATQGLVALVGVTHSDTPSVARRMAESFGSCEFLTTGAAQPMSAP